MSSAYICSCNVKIPKKIKCVPCIQRLANSLRDPSSAIGKVENNTSPNRTLLVPPFKRNKEMLVHQFRPNESMLMVLALESPSNIRLMSASKNYVRYAEFKQKNFILLWHVTTYVCQCYRSV